MTRQLKLLVTAIALSAVVLVSQAATTTDQKLNEAKNKMVTDYNAAKAKLKAKYKQDTPAAKSEYNAAKRKLDREAQKAKQDYEAAKQKWNNSNTKKALDKEGDKIKSKWDKDTSQD